MPNAKSILIPNSAARTTRESANEIKRMTREQDSSTETSTPTNQIATTATDEITSPPRITRSVWRGKSKAKSLSAVHSTQSRNKIVRPTQARRKHIQQDHWKLKADDLLKQQSNQAYPLGIEYNRHARTRDLSDFLLKHVSLKSDNSTVWKAFIGSGKKFIKYDKNTKTWAEVEANDASGIISNKMNNIRRKRRLSIARQQKNRIMGIWKYLILEDLWCMAKDGVKAQSLGTD